MEPRRLEWDPVTGKAKIPIAEPEYQLLVCVAEGVGLSSEWLASELFRAVVWKFAEGVTYTGQQWLQDSKLIPRPVFRLKGDSEPASAESFAGESFAEQ